MSPKHAAAISRWGRTFRNSARKSIPNSNPTSPSNSPLPFSTTAAAAETVATSQPSTASSDSQSIRSSDAETTLPKLPRTTAVLQLHSLPETLDSNSGLVNSDSGNIDGNTNAESGKSIELEKPDIEQPGAEKMTQVETASVVGGGGDGNKNTADLPSSLSQLENEGKLVTGPEIGADGVAESGNGKKKKKIVKKVLRVVKVIKKRVPKKVLANDSENQGLMVKAEESEVISSFGNNETEKSNSVDELIDKPSIVSKANDIPNIADDIAENLKLVNDDVIEKSNEINEEANITKKVDRKSELNNSAGLSEPINVETSKFNVGASEQMVKSIDGIPCDLDSMEVEKVNHIAENVIETDIFVGGLDKKKTKGDDIRKVFEEVGVVVEVRLAMFPSSVKNRGYAFVRFATAADAKNALAKCYNVEICGKQCSVAPVGKISLGNLEKNWKTEYVVTLLEKAGIEKIVKVTRKKKSSLAFLEFGTSEDAQIAFNKLRKKDAFGKNPMVEVEWAEPDEEENLNVKSVYAEYLPSSWDEEKVREYFKRFGEIENVVLATDLFSSRRKDSAFIHYTNRDAALKCIEVVSRERSEDHSSKVMIDVSLANLNPTNKLMECTPDRTSKQLPIAKRETIKNSVWSRLGTRDTKHSLLNSEISAKLHDRLAPIPLKRQASFLDEVSPAKKPKSLSGSTSPAFPTSSLITTGVLNLADGKMAARYIQSLCPSPDRPTLDKLGDTELIDSYCLDHSKAMAKLAVIVSRSQRGFTNPELINELNSLKKDNAKLRSELAKSRTVVLRLMDVAETFRTRAKSQEGEIKNMENENVTLRAEMDKLRADYTKHIDETRMEGLRAGHRGFPELKDGLALFNRPERSQRGLSFVRRNFGSFTHLTRPRNGPRPWGFNEKFEREGPLGEAPYPPGLEFCK